MLRFVFGRAVFALAVLIMTVRLGSNAYALDVIAVSAGPATFTQGSGPVVVDPSLSMIADDRGRIASATVNISNYVNGQDVLAATPQHGISVLWNSGTGTLNLTGNASASQYRDVLRSVTYNNTSGSPNTNNRTLVFTLIPANLFATTNHFYETVPDVYATYDAALLQASTFSWLGVSGYLGTVTSPAENNFVFGINSVSAYTGASDRDVEGVWRWLTGPETGQILTYFNWENDASHQEPNNAQGRENLLVINGQNPVGNGIAPGQWHDRFHPDGHSSQFLVEYGAPGSDASTLVLTGSKIVSFDNTAPTVIISGVPGTSNAPFTATFTFSEPVNDFALGDITVGNGAASAFTGADGDTVFTALITPAANGTVAIDVAAAVAQDLTGNDNTAATQAVSAFDGTAPTVAISAPGEVRGTFIATFLFSETVTGFTLADINVGNGTPGNLVAVSGSHYTASISPVSDGNATTTVTLNVAAGVAQDGAGNDNLAANPVAVNFIDEDFVRTRTRRAIANFMAQRADQITASEPNLVARLNRSGGAGGTGSTGGPIGFTANGTLTNNRLTFATSLRQVLGSSDTKHAKLRTELGQMMGLGQQDATGTLGNRLRDDGLDIWVQGTVLKVENDTLKSDLGMFYLGIDYHFSPSLLVGFLTQFDWTDQTDVTQGVKVDGKGWMAGPYVVARLHDNLIFDGRVAWGRSANHVSPFATYEDAFDGERWLARGQFTGDFTIGSWNFAPSVGVIYFEENQKAYVDALNIAIPGQIVSLGRLTFGPQFSTNFQTPGGTVIAPHMSLTGIWDFKKAEIVDLATGLASGTDDLRARFEGGVSIQMPNGWGLNGAGFYDGIGASNFKAYGGSLRLTVPLN